MKKTKGEMVVPFHIDNVTEAVLTARTAMMATKHWIPGAAHASGNAAPAGSSRRLDRALLRD